MFYETDRDFNFQMVEEDNPGGLQQLNNFITLRVRVYAQSVS